MFRALLTIALMMLISLPHGICFCHYLYASPAPQANTMDATQTQANPQPTDEHEDHERDCPCCKLRQVPERSPQPATVERDGHSCFLMLALVDDPGTALVNALPHIAASGSRPADQPLALIPCALRI